MYMEFISRMSDGSTVNSVSAKAAGLPEGAPRTAIA